MGLLVVQGGPVPEMAVLAEMLAVVGRDHDPCIGQLPRVAQAGEEPAELGIDAEQALVVQVAEATGDGVELRLPLGPMLRVGGVARLSGPPALSRSGIRPGGRRPVPEPPHGLGGRHVGAMHVHEIQEEEERRAFGGVRSRASLAPWR